LAFGRPGLHSSGRGAAEERNSRSSGKELGFFSRRPSMPLLDLPHDALLQILRHLRLSELLSASSACTLLLAAASADELWIALFRERRWTLTVGRAEFAQAPAARTRQAIAAAGGCVPRAQQAAAFREPSLHAASHAPWVADRA